MGGGFMLCFRARGAVASGEERTLTDDTRFHIFPPSHIQSSHRGFLRDLSVFLFDHDTAVPGTWQSLDYIAGVIKVFSTCGYTPETTFPSPHIFLLKYCCLRHHTSTDRAVST